MADEECELAHTAGLLHDIGHFALSDRVAERGRTLTEEDWMAIQRHPELGADMLRDLGMYGPVAEIVLAHHERIDGRGYPRGLTEDEIPEIAKIISVAEVYDTLTASDTYRTRMSSFEALTELRRVAGSRSTRATSRCWRGCSPARASTIATPTWRTSTSSSTWSAGSGRRRRRLSRRAAGQHAAAASGAGADRPMPLSRPGARRPTRRSAAPASRRTGRSAPG